MKSFALLLLMSGICLAQTLLPPAPGQRIVVEVSTDLTHWQQAMPYNTPRGFIRARTDINEQFAAWITDADALGGADMAILVNGQRNAQCWGAGIDLTPLCVSSAGGVLVSPCHVLFVSHAYPGIGQTLQWLTDNNQTITRTITATDSLPTTSYLHPDITVARLDADVPDSISFVAVFADESMRDWTGYRVPVVLRDQFNDLHEADVVDVSEVGEPAPTVFLQQPLDVNRLARYKTIISGDSGSPVCLVENGRLVLLTLLSRGGSGSGTFLAAYVESINAAMTALGGGHQLSIQSTND